jgi:hypothetical protein
MAAMTRHYCLPPAEAVVSGLFATPAWLRQRRILTVAPALFPWRFLDLKITAIGILGAPVRITQAARLLFGTLAERLGAA